MSIKHNDIPPEVVEAAATALCGRSEPCRVCAQAASNVILAALNAWSGAQFSPPFNGADIMMPAALHLPLPQTRKSGTYDDEFGKLWA